MEVVEPMDYDIYKNGEGYNDPTAYRAIRKVARDKDPELERFHKLLYEIRDICEIHGFSIEGRIILKDNTTGKIWR